MIIPNKGKEDKMNNEIDDHKIKELKEMIKDKDPNTPVEKLLAIFCERHSLSSETCRYYYNLLVDQGILRKK
jgi:hypothetical protein